MKKLILTLIAITFFLTISTSNAQIKSESWLWTLNLGFASIKNEATKNTINGYTFNSTIEKKIRNQPIAYGVNVSYLSADDQFAISNEGKTITSSISSTAFFLTMKYLFSRSEVVPYIGLGLGINLATNNVAYTGYDIVQPASSGGHAADLTSLAVAVPVGVNFFMGEGKPYFGINVVPTWTEKTFFDSNFNFLYNLSLGFQF